MSVGAAVPRQPIRNANLTAHQPPTSSTIDPGAYIQVEVTIAIGGSLTATPHQGMRRNPPPFFRLELAGEWTFLAPWRP